jgi:hypothetical protein
VDTITTAMTEGDAPEARVRGSDLGLRLARLAGEASGEGVTGLFEFTASNRSLRVGQVLTVELELPTVDDAVAIPRSALYGNDHLYRIRDGRLERVRIERLGAAADTDDAGQSLLLVRAPALSAGDRIATTQLPNAVDGLKVRWQDEANEAAAE